MKNLILLLIITGLFYFKTPLVLAGSVAENSAQLQYLLKTRELKSSIQNSYGIKKAIKEVLKKYNSPLIGEVDNFVNVCAKYKIDCYLLPAIAGLESTFGHFIYPGSYNPFGWGGGYIIFSSWSEAIEKVGAGLRYNYLNQGVANLWSIGKIYSESPSWAIRVQYFINQFAQEEEKILLFFSKNSVQL